MGSSRDPLDAVPVVLPGARSEPLARGGLAVVLPQPARGRIGGFLERRLGMRRERRFELDAVGARFFREIDGNRPLEAIRGTLVREFGFEDSAARTAVITFTAELMRRGVIGLATKEGAERV